MLRIPPENPATVNSHKANNNSYSLFPLFAVVSRVKDGDDTDLMTDIFASLFGTRSVVSRDC